MRARAWVVTVSVVVAMGTAAVPAAATEPDAASATVLVRTASEDVASAVAARHELTLVRAFPWIGWYELATPPGTIDARAVQAALDADPDVRDTDTVQPGEQISLAFTPRDPVWTAGVLSTGEQAAWHLTRANFPSAWDRSTGRGAAIGIIDSEFDITHPELAPKIRNPYNTSNGTPDYHTGNVRAANTDPADVLHGTHVAGIAAATTDNGVGLSGAGFEATIVPVRVVTRFRPGGGDPVDADFVGDLTEALGYIANSGVGVVNMSLQGTRAHPPLQAAINAVRARGITVVASAGNQQQTWPNAPIYPASYDGVIAVANTQVNDTINPTSSNGSWVDVAAPGTNILSAWDLRATRFTLGSQPNYEVLTGTSMAAPLVAGLVGLMKSVRPDLTPDEVEAILKSTARDLGSAGPDPQFGAGLVDAAAAVNAAIAYARPAPPAAPPPAAAPDTVAPRVKVNGLVTVRGRSVRVRLSCAEACAGRVRLRTNGRRLLASRAFSAPANTTVTVRLRARKRLRANTRVIVEVAARDAAGNLATQSQRRKLRR